MDENRRRKLRIEGPAETVVRHWLTGEVLVDRPAERRRPHYKTERRRNLATTARRPSGQVSLL